jgi:hypothetical protein
MGGGATAGLEGFKGESHSGVANMIRLIRMDQLTIDISGTGNRIWHRLAARARASLSVSYCAMIAAQEAKAQAIVLPYLARHDDAILLANGFSEADIIVLRRRAEREPRLWY